MAKRIFTAIHMFAGQALYLDFQQKASKNTERRVFCQADQLVPCGYARLAENTGQGYPGPDHRTITKTELDQLPQRIPAVIMAEQFSVA